MMLWVDSDASYLAEPEAKSRIAGFFHLSQHPNITSNPNINGPIHVECKSLRHVVTSVAEEEISGVFHNVNTAMPMRHMLNDSIIHNLLLEQRLTIPRLIMLHITTSNKSVLSPGTCVIIG